MDQAQEKIEAFPELLSRRDDPAESLFAPGAHHDLTLNTWLALHLFSIIVHFNFILSYFFDIDQMCRKNINIYKHQITFTESRMKYVLIVDFWALWM